MTIFFARLLDASLSNFHIKNATKNAPIGVKNVSAVISPHPLNRFLPFLAHNHHLRCRWCGRRDFEIFKFFRVLHSQKIGFLAVFFIQIPCRTVAAKRYDTNAPKQKFYQCQWWLWCTKFQNADFLNFCLSHRVFWMARAKNVKIVSTRVLTWPVPIRPSKLVVIYLSAY